MNVVRASLRSAALLVGLFGLVSVSWAASRGSPPERSARVIVAFKADAAVLRMQVLTAHSGGDQVSALAQRHAGTLSTHAGLPLQAGRLFGSRSMVLQAQGLTSAALAARLASHPDVAYAVPDRRRRALLVPNDPLFAAGPASGQGPTVGQWYLRAPDATLQSAVNAQGAWDWVTGSNALVVAVLDTGVRTEHPDLASRMVSGHDMIEDRDTANDGNGRDTDPRDPGDWITLSEDADGSGPYFDCGTSDSSWHGTQVAGIIGAAANDGLGMAGTAHGVRILPVRVLGKCGGFDSDIIAGMYWAVGKNQPGLRGSSTPARVLNLSLGGEGACDFPYRNAVAEITAAPYHAVVVAAAGNSTGHAVGTPANCPGVIGVAGLRHTGSKVGFSDLGPEVAIAAPAGNCVNIDPGSACLYPILTTSNSGTRGPTTGSGGSIWTDSHNISVGTSFSAPIVAGAAALVLSARPGLTSAEVTAVLQRTARAFPSTGSDNGVDDPSPVLQCRAPDGTDQLQCYCSTGLCGAGMLDVGAAALDAVQGRPLDEAARLLLELGERTYPEYFPGSPKTQQFGPFAYRFYPSKGTYLALVVRSDAPYELGGVYVMGGPFGDSPQRVGRLSDFITPLP